MVGFLCAGIPQNSIAVNVSGEIRTLLLMEDSEVSEYTGSSFFEKNAYFTNLVHILYQGWEILPVYL